MLVKVVAWSSLVAMTTSTSWAWTSNEGETFELAPVDQSTGYAATKSGLATVAS